jgi:ABC-type ATPase involved in cell division
LIIRRLDRFLRDGGALLTATHDARVARALAHRVIEIKNGQIEEKEALDIPSGLDRTGTCTTYKRIAN